MGPKLGRDQTMQQIWLVFLSKRFSCMYIYYTIMHYVGWCHMRIPVKIGTDVTLEILMVNKYQ